MAAVEVAAAFIICTLASVVWRIINCVAHHQSTPLSTSPAACWVGSSALVSSITSRSSQSISAPEGGGGRRGSRAQRLLVIDVAHVRC